MKQKIPQSHVPNLFVQNLFKIKKKIEKREKSNQWLTLHQGKSFFFFFFLTSLVRSLTEPCSLASEFSFISAWYVTILFFLHDLDFFRFFFFFSSITIFRPVDYWVFIYGIVVIKLRDLADVPVSLDWGFVFCCNINIISIFCHFLVIPIFRVFRFANFQAGPISRLRTWLGATHWRTLDSWGSTSRILKSSSQGSWFYEVWAVGATRKREGGCFYRDWRSRWWMVMIWRRLG